MTPSRSRAPLAALLATLAVACGAAGVLLLGAPPEAAGADVGRVPLAVAIPGGAPPPTTGPRDDPGPLPASPVPPPPLQARARPSGC